MLTTLVLLIINANVSFADPIQDQYFLNKEVGWFQSQSQSCRSVCYDMKRSKPEYELYYSNKPNNKVTYTCKANITTRYSKGELYGNNFQAAPNVCLITLPNGQAVRKTQFKCLCVI